MKRYDYTVLKATNHFLAGSIGAENEEQAIELVSNRYNCTKELVEVKYMGEDMVEFYKRNDNLTWDWKELKWKNH